MYKNTRMIIFSAPKPECTSDPECPYHLACIQEKCQDPCYSHSCGRNAECKAKNHRAICICFPGYVGDPYSFCEERKKSSNHFHKFTKWGAMANKSFLQLSIYYIFCSWMQVRL